MQSIFSATPTSSAYLATSKGVLSSWLKISWSECSVLTKTFGIKHKKLMISRLALFFFAKQKKLFSSELSFCTTVTPGNKEGDAMTQCSVSQSRCRPLALIDLFAQSRARNPRAKIPATCHVVLFVLFPDALFARGPRVHSRGVLVVQPLYLKKRLADQFSAAPPPLLTANMPLL